MGVNFPRIQIQTVVDYLMEFYVLCRLCGAIPYAKSSQTLINESLCKLVVSCPPTPSCFPLRFFTSNFVCYKLFFFVGEKTFGLNHIWKAKEKSIEKSSNYQPQKWKRKRTRIDKFKIKFKMCQLNVKYVGCRAVHNSIFFREMFFLCI